MLVKYLVFEIVISNVLIDCPTKLCSPGIKCYYIATEYRDCHTDSEKAFNVRCVNPL